MKLLRKGEGASRAQRRAASSFPRRGTSFRRGGGGGGGGGAEVGKPPLTDEQTRQMEVVAREYRAQFCRLEKATCSRLKAPLGCFDLARLI